MIEMGNHALQARALFRDAVVNHARGDGTNESRKSGVAWSLTSTLFPDLDVSQWPLGWDFASVSSFFRE
jgi:hypothetical protein